jgi:phytoene dehydrogenase-like protein
LEDHGGEVRTSCLVKKFKLSGNDCVGVILEDGEEILAKKAVVSNFNVMQIPEMVGEDWLPADYVSKTKRLKLSDFMAFHMELALNEAPKYNNDMTPRETWFTEFVDNYDLDAYMRTFDDLKYGIPNTRAPLVMCPTILDQTRTPEGKHTLYVYQYAPHDLKEGGPEAWDDLKEEIMDGLLQTLDEHCTNMTSDNILGKWAMSPYDYARYNPSWPKGDFTHFNATIMQSASYRPFPGWSHYKTPIDKLYLCGPSTHPGWAVTGSARTAMWTIFEELGMDFEEMTK